MDRNLDVEVEITEEQNPNTEVSLFLKKLWKMVNDKDVEHIICWNETEDGFIILDQFELSRKVLPQYFKHNNMSSFVRQLHLYNFKKVQTTNNRVEFTHKYFVKSVPELLVLIRRKIPVGRQKETSSNEEKKSFLDEIKQLRSKNLLINKELTLLKQENLTLWGELNSLRLKYNKQTSIVNKLIHFLITYIHTHQTSYAKQNMGASRSNQNNLKSSPKILELDYKGKKITNQNSCSIFEPGTSNSHGTITYSVKIPENPSKTNRTLQEILSSNVSMTPNRNSASDITYSIKLPRDQSGKMMSTDLLLELLRENDRLSIENPSEDVLTEALFEYEDPVQEFEPAFSSSAGTTTYTVSYPKEHTQNIQSQRDSPAITPIRGSVSDKSVSAPAERFKMNTEPQLGKKIELPARIKNVKQLQAAASALNKTKTPKVEELKINQTLLELLKENESLNFENKFDIDLEAQQESPDLVSVAPIVETPDVEIEYLVEAPNSNDNGLNYVEMDCVELPERVENGQNDNFSAVVSSDLETEYLVQTPETILNQNNINLDQVEVLSELLKVVEPIVDTSEPSARGHSKSSQRNSSPNIFTSGAKGIPKKINKSAPSVSNNPVQVPFVPKTAKTTSITSHANDRSSALMTTGLSKIQNRSSTPLLQRKEIVEKRKQEPDDYELQRSLAVAKKRPKPEAYSGSKKIWKNEHSKENTSCQSDMLTYVQAMENSELVSSENGGEISTLFDVSTDSNPNGMIITEVPGNNFNSGLIVSETADKSIPTSNELNLLEIETCPEDMSLLQDFLDSIDSEELGGILSIDDKNVSGSNDGGLTNKTQEEETHVVDSSVDQYFNSSFFD